MKILLTTDGSEFSRLAAQYVADHLADLAAAPEIHVLNVHPPLPYRRAATVLGKKALEGYYAEEATKALAVAKKVLDKAGLAYEASFRVGDVVAGRGRSALVAVGPDPSPGRRIGCGARRVRDDTTWHTRSGAVRAI